MPDGSKKVGLILLDSLYVLSKLSQKPSYSYIVDPIVGKERVEQVKLQRALVLHRNKEVCIVSTYTAVTNPTEWTTLSPPVSSADRCQPDFPARDNRFKMVCEHKIPISRLTAPLRI